MTTCCARLSKVYMITTNTLFICLGIAFIAFGLIGMKDGFNGATLFPDNIFKYIVILGIIICVAALFGITGAYVKKNIITYLYMIIIIAALIFQVLIGVQIYQKAANSSKYLSDLWSIASTSYRANLQNQFNCCGFQTSIDNYALTNRCQPTTSLTNPLSPCAYILQQYIKSTFSKIYYIIFAALALQLLAMSNAITLLCTSGDKSYDDEEERRKRRKSGIRLDDMTVDTPTTLVGSPIDEHKYYDDYYRNGNNNSRYDSYDMYRYNNDYNQHHHHHDNNRGNTYY
ncbi:Tetraspanin family-domain-containing protein [Cokeromyces recurvatus]|uniref:Tetraspanin family-domain-containing protein n=1 Tax=Cokeromyces recurvatus TaxID=90255 RepID=UPI00222107A8|nr:Tetraspanin family-domain-containing protein [Cokeromyces recurvatus]KAI7904742.1 Tetraspanin family-domain-containing protein [Cokeromyces recurvatus]